MELHSEDPRFLDGVRLFNAREYFDAHEVWEDLWHDMAGPERRFVQGLIQAAVCVYHASNGNSKGALRLFESARRYMNLFDAVYWGLDVILFWVQMEKAFSEFFTQPAPENARIHPDLLPVIVLGATNINLPDINESTHKA